MKKSIVGIAALAIVGLVGAPYVTGWLAESETHRIVGEINKSSAEYGTTEIMSYERGVRSSHIVYEYEFPASLSPIMGQGDKVLYECHYEHGLVGIDYSCDFLSNPAYKEFVNLHLGGENPLLIIGRISAFGGFTQEISTKSIDKTMDDGRVIKLSASDVKLKFNGDFSSFVVQADIGTADLQGKGGSIKLGESSLGMNVKLTDLGLFSGDLNVKAGALKIVAKQKNIRLDGLKFNGTTTERGKVMDTSLQVRVERFSSDSPGGLAVEKMDIDTEFLGINSQAFVDYQNFARTLKVDLMANAEQGGQAKVDPNQRMALLTIVEKMLEKGLNIKLSVSGDVNGKPNVAELNLKLLEKVTFAQLSALMFNPESVLNSIDFRVSGFLNKEFIESNTTIGPVVDKSELVVLEGEAYRFNIKLAEMSEVNGKKVSFQELQSMVISSMM